MPVRLYDIHKHLLTVYRLCKIVNKSNELLIIAYDSITKVLSLINLPTV